LHERSQQLAGAIESKETLMRKAMALFIALVSVLTVASCSTKSNDSVSATTTAESRGDDETTTTRSSGTTEDDDSSSDGGSTGSGSLSLTECASAAVAFGTLSLGFTGDEAQASELENQLNELQGKIPDQIRDDFETVRNAYQAYFQALRDAGGNILDPDVQQQLQGASDALDTPEVQAANERISDYFENTCGR
jgi:hypothetical protein